MRLAFEWDITAKGLLALQLSAMERVLAQRQEILCMLSPVLAARAMAWAKLQDPRHHDAKVRHMQWLEGFPYQHCRT